MVGEKYVFKQLAKKKNLVKKSVELRTFFCVVFGRILTKKINYIPAVVWEKCVLLLILPNYFNIRT